MLVALVLCGLSGCAGEGRDPPTGPFAGIEIVFSASVAEEEKPAVQGLLERFQRTTGATVTLAMVTAADLPEKLAVEVGAERPSIHLFAQDNLALRILVDRGLVLPLGDVPVPDAVPARMIPAFINGTRFFLPFRPNVRVAYANRARFRQAGLTPPRTVDELRTVARQLKAASGGSGKDLSEVSPESAEACRFSTAD